MFNYISSILEIVATLLSILYLYYISKSKKSAWYFSIASVSLFAYLVFQQKLYSQFLLQCFYILTSLAGWWNWNKNSNSKIKKYKFNQHILIILIGLISSIIAGFVMQHYFNANFAFFDACVSVFSVIATVLIILKIVENWLYWIVIDLFSFYLYFEQNLKTSSILFLVYTIMAVYGYLEWQNKWKEEQLNA
jgi:nicotinamide mononucleotide transporter